MNLRFLLVLGIVCRVAGAGPEEDLKFAQLLSKRGLKEMALKVLTDLEQSSDPAAARAGRFGKAQLTKFEADLARNRFLRDLAEGREPRITREQVVALYAEAQPRIEEYVRNRPENDDARFLLGELLQEYAEFLTGSDYPESMADQRAALLKQNKEAVAKLFEGAIDSFKKVAERLRGKVSIKAPPDDPNYVRLSLAEFNAGLARFRWACVYPKGPNFQHRADTAIEELDDFLQNHYDELVGAYSMIYLGRSYYEKAMRLGDPGDGEIAINYFETVFKEVEADPAVPETFQIVGTAFYWYCKTCNAMARGSGHLKKALPIYFQNTLKIGSEIRQKLKQGSKTRMALRALLEVAEAEAAQHHFDQAVRLAGDVLSTARVEHLRGTARLATAKLTAWVANVRGAGALDPGLLFQIGASLIGQGRVANAITFFEKAVTAGTTDDEKEKYGYPAMLEIAKAYRRDKRYFAAAEVAWKVVQDFLGSGADQESDFALTASEACNQARLAWRSISDFTKSSEHKSRYESVLGTFRAKFPSHSANAHKDYGRAIEFFTRSEFEAAATAFQKIAPGSPNFWAAQRRIPQCYYILAQREKDTAKAKGWFTKTLEAAQALVARAAAVQGDEDARKGDRYGRLYAAIAQSKLSLWKQALAGIDVYLARYGGKFIRRGLELKIKIDGHLALGQLDKAEAALASLKQRMADSPYLKGEIVDVYNALRTRYKEMATGAQRTALAGRAADLWEEHLRGQEESRLTERDYYALADALADAGRWKDAGSAYESAAGIAGDPKSKAHFTLQAARATFEAALSDPSIRGIARVKILKKTRQLFTDVLIPDRSKQATVLQALADYKKYPQRATFNQIKRRPQVLLTAAKVYEASSDGTDGRWIAVRLINYLHSFTRAVADENNEKLKELIPYWWEGAELKLRILAAIKESGTGQSARAGQAKGHAFANKIIFQYQKMDGPERVQRIQALAARLK